MQSLDVYCASPLTGTKRMVGRVAASAIASASWSSFLFALWDGPPLYGAIG